MRTATEQQTVDNFALWDTFTGYPQAGGHSRTISPPAQRAHRAFMSLYDAPR